MERGMENLGSNMTMNLNTKVRDIEEKQRILQERMLLIGQNLIETKEIYLISSKYSHLK